MKRLIPLFLVVLMLCSLISLVPFAAEKADGWRIDEDGKERYYVDGEYVTGLYTVGNFVYRFNDDGEYVEVWDGHYNVGDNTTANSQAYKNALISLKNSGGTLYGYHTFEDNQLYSNVSFTNEIAVDTEYGDVKAEKNTTLYSKVDGIFSSDTTRRFQVVHRYTTFKTLARSGGGRMLQIRSSDTTAVHNYANMYIGAPAGAELVIEGEFMLGENYASPSSLFQLIDRGNVDTSANYMPALITVNKSGGVYLASDNSAFICVLSRNELTRISVSLHPASNTFDVYVNGLLVVSGATLLTDSTYNPMNFTVDELRTAQFSTLGLGSMYVDNFAAYTAAKPVNTVTAPAKNGAYLEGGYIRYYENNRVVYGARSVTGTFGGVTLNGETLDFGTSTGNGGATIGNTASVIVNGVVSSETRIAGNVFVAPEAVKPDKGGFGGWSVTDGGKELFLSPGQRYHMTGDITCRAVEMDFEMLSGASVRTNPDSTGLRFMAKINRDQYDTLIASGATVEPHIVIVPTVYFENTYGYYTVDALKGSGYDDMIDIKATEWYESSPGYYYYTGSVANILPESYTLDYSGVAYLRITYSNGAVCDVYADYSEENHSRSVYRVAHAAYNDRTTLEGQMPYGNKIVYGGRDTFSPYSPDRMSVIKGFADRVIMLESSLGEVGISGSFYDAPYTVEGKYNAVTLKTDITVKPSSGWSVSQAYGVVMNGKPLRKSEYTMGESVCTLSLAVSGEEISGYPIYPDSAESWLMFDASSNYSGFTGKNTNPAYCYNGESASAKLSYSSSGASIKCGILKKMGKYMAYSSNGQYCWDMSDIKAMKFAVYSEKSGQTLYFIAHSENPDTDGIDYYAIKLNLNSGWNEFSIAGSDMSSNRTPLGWNKITQLQFTHTGWSQSNDTSNVIYVSNITAFDSVQAVNPFSIPQLSDASAFALGGYYCSVDGIRCRSSHDTEATAFSHDGKYYVPLAAVA
ncbi:MAG: hypothetical protein IKB34_07755, partial [Clostridia bacterium]|nr:hypothetical protein [Clostridia bacterium]